MLDGMSTGELLLTICYVLSIAGQALVARKNRIGFALSLGGNICAVIAGVLMGVRPMIVFSSCWAIPNIYALFTWKAEQ